jgi:hypothetical protein
LGFEFRVPRSAFRVRSMADNRIYKSSEAMQIEPDELSAEARRVLAEELICSLGEDPHLHELTEKYRLVFTLEGKCVETTELFCTLVGYTNSQVLGKTLGDLTAPGTVNLAKHLGAVFQCDYMQGLWLFVHRQGTRILVRYESQLLPELLIEMRIDPIGVGH